MESRVCCKQVRGPSGAPGSCGFWPHFLTRFSWSPTVFICSYMFLAPCFGYLGDRYNRKYLMSVGICFWSVVTLASSYTPKEVSEVAWTL